METQQCCESESNYALFINDTQSNANESNSININDMRDDEFKPSKLSSNLPDYNTLNNNVTLHDYWSQCYW